jgi:hypothetical protein
MIKIWLIISLLLLTPASQAEELQSNQLVPNVQLDQLFINAQIALDLTPTMEEALAHGISLEYTIEISLRDPDQPFWRNPVNSKRTRVKVAYDSLKRTYLLTNLTLQRFSTDRDLKRTMNTLGNLQDIPLISLSQLQSGHTYQIRVQAQLERDALPNALRLSTLFDRDWRTDMGQYNRYWTAP